MHYGNLGHIFPSQFECKLYVSLVQFFVLNNLFRYFTEGLIFQAEIQVFHKLSSISQKQINC